jgi:hypothetical protein
MKKSEHTPGPWVQSGWAILENQSGTVICNILPWDASGSRPEDLANSALIAAAPDMLIALETLLDCSTVADQWWVDLVKDAVSKARNGLVPA